MLSIAAFFAGAIIAHYTILRGIGDDTSRLSDLWEALKGFPKDIWYTTVNRLW
jgi:hypothetical protein